MKVLDLSQGYFISYGKGEAVKKPFLHPSMRNPRVFRVRQCQDFNVSFQTKISSDNFDQVR